MTTSSVHPTIGEEVPTPDRLFEAFRAEPGVGFKIVDGQGVFRFVNERAAEMLLESTPDAMIGRTLDEIYGEEVASERLEVFDEVAKTGRPAIFRHIRFGVQLQSTIRLLSEEQDEHRVFLIITVEGEHTPPHPERFSIVESHLAHLGPLDPLSRREIEVLALIGHGMTTPQIAQALHRSPRTIERHCDSLRFKLEATNRVQLAEFASRAGLRVEDADLKRV